MSDKCAYIHAQIIEEDKILHLQSQADGQLSALCLI